jgi:hypothetical protein
MAKNLRLKLPKDDQLHVLDVNSAATKRFVEELAAYQVTIAGSARELSEKSVSHLLPFTSCYPFHDDFQ